MVKPSPVGRTALLRPLAQPPPSTSIDYIESLETSVRKALAACGRDVADAIRSISFDTTASTPALTDAKGTPLACCEFAGNPIRCLSSGRTIRLLQKRTE